MLVWCLFYWFLIHSRLCNNPFINDEITQISNLLLHFTSFDVSFKKNVVSFIDYFQIGFFIANFKIQDKICQWRRVKKWWEDKTYLSKWPQRVANTVNLNLWLCWMRVNEWQMPVAKFKRNYCRVGINSVVNTILLGTREIRVVSMRRRGTNFKLASRDKKWPTEADIQPILLRSQPKPWLMTERVDQDHHVEKEPILAEEKVTLWTEPNI